MKRNKYKLQIFACCLTSIIIAFSTIDGLSQPANDLCANATPLTVDATETCVPTAVDNNAATDSGELPAPSCASYSGGDTWYSVTVPASGIVSVETNNDGSGTITDSGMSLYSGTCGALAEIECDDDDSADGLFSLINLTGLTPGDVIFVRVWEFGNDVAGTFSVCAYEPLPPPPPPANDECANPVALPVNADLACGMVINTTIESATDSGLDTPPEDNVICGGTEDDDIWFTFVATNNQHQIDLTNITGSTTDLYHSVWEGNCGALTNLLCSDPNTSTLTGLTPGNTYYVRIYSWTATTGQDSVFDVCIGTPPPPPPGDECADPIPYPGDVEAGTCVTGFDFTIFSDNGNPSPTCDFGGDAVVWFSWTAPIITAAGDPIDLNFDDGDGQAMDCDIGIEVYETDCTTPASNCLSNVSGNLTGLIQGTDYVLLVYQDSPASAACDFCLSIACSSPIATGTAICQPGDEANFYVEVNVTNIGVVNTAYTVDIAGPQANITATGITTYGPFPSGTPVDVVLVGVDDVTCGITILGLDKSCNIVDGIAQGDTFCNTDATVAATPIIPPDPGVTAVLTAEGTFDGEIGLGLYDGTWDDGSVIGLPPAGLGLFGTDAETQLEAATPNAGAGSTDPDVAIAGSWGDPASLGASFASAPLVDGNTYTLFIIDDFGDGWNGNDADLVDCEGNVILGNLNQYIEPIAGDDQDEVAWITFTYTAPVATVTWSGAGAVTDDPDGLPNSGDEEYTFDPSMAGAAGCDPTDVDLTMSVLFCGVTCDEVVTVTVNPPAQAPTITRDDDVCNYTIAPACPGDVLDVTTATAAPGEDPAAIDVTVTTANACMATFPVDPAACPPPGAVCQGIDIAGGLPVIPTEVCSGATADICLTLVDATEGLVVTGTIDGAPVNLIGVAGAGAEELCVTIDAPINETCDIVDAVILIDAIQCTDGTDFPGILGGATLVEDLTNNSLNPINVPVYPTLMVNTSGDGTCGMLTAELVAADGTVCTTAAGSPFMCAADGDVLAFDFTGDPALDNFAAVPTDCPLPMLSGTLTCANCDGDATCTLMAPACNACPDPACDISTTIDLMTGMELNDAAEFGGATPAVFPDYDITTNMGTLTLPMGGDQIFAVSGVTDLSLPNNISEVCLTMDINVISGEIPFLLEFRIENGVAGQQLQFNTMVDGLGMCSVGGNLADAAAAGGFTFMNGASYAVVAAIADFDGTPVSEDLVVEISNIMLTVCAPDPAISGCTDMAADNFDPAAQCDDGSCLFTIDCTLMAPACNACPDPACDISTVIDIASGTILNDSQGGGATPVFPNYDNAANMGTLTLPAGGDMIFAVSGVTDLSLPNNISEVCLTMDINVISGEVPFLLEFRIENGVAGQQLQFNTMVDGLGMCSVGGNFADAVPAAGFIFMNGVSYAVVAAIADFDGTPVSEDLVVEISNIMLTVCAPDPAISGCTDPTADNFDPAATCDDGSCMTNPTCPMCGACETPNELPFAEIGGGDPDFSFAGADASDDGTQMIINAGGNNTFAGHGYFIDQSAIPAGAVNEDYCIFGDFNVIADPADLPFTIEFRIENNGVGTFIEFNTVVSTSGPITIGGNLSTGGLVGPFDINGPAPALVVAIAIPGLSGNAPPTQDIIVEYSNIYITDGTCNPVIVETPTAPLITDAACPDGMNLEPGVIDYSSTTCTNANDVLEYSLDAGATWSTVQPTYADIEAAALGNTLDVRCECEGNTSAPVQVVINPGACMTACQGIDIVAGLPVIPTEVCSGATADICLTLIDAAEGLVVTGTIDGVAVTLTGMASGNANELCVTINAPANETCDVVDAVIQIDAITCTDGTDYPGILGGATLLDDLTGAELNPINVPVYPTLSVATSGDGTCGMLTAELVATNGAVCATAAGSPFTCTNDGDVLNYDFTGDVALENFIAVPADCPLPTLMGNLTCVGCTCEDAITGNINVEEPTCDITGMMVEILDSNGMPVVGSPAMVDPATGDYSLPGPFPCGTYTVEIVVGTAPICYEQLGGTVGPFAFEINGDGIADGANFGTTPQIPTLSQWGLITLALLMMCFGAIKIGLPVIFTSKNEIL